jgi:hypothetical protein
MKHTQQGYLRSGFSTRHNRKTYQKKKSEYLQKIETVIKRGGNKYFKPNCTGKSTHSVTSLKITTLLHCLNCAYLKDFLLMQIRTLPSWLHSSSCHPWLG